ncbi:MAG: hypothetical protein HYS32_00100 [Candidatus Woesearchaeota archaeon]|nr:MAG: hypothetical protein HYS32_00100 [Candidatus Woesearchaeota archaeon]
MKEVILDTNFLVEIIKNKIDLKQELTRVIDETYQVFILDKTIEEIKKLKNIYKIALELIKKIRIIETDKSYVDDLLVEFSKKGYIIATQDKLLKKRLKRPIIIMKQKKYLELLN